MSTDVPELVGRAASSDSAGRRAGDPGAGGGRRDRAVHRALPQGADRQPGRGRDPRGDRRQGALGRAHQAAGVHRRGDRPPGEADARAGGAASAATFDATALEDIYLPYKQKRKTKAADGARGGAGAAGRLAVGVRARRGRRRRRDARGARGRFRRRGEGRRRRGRRAGGRGRHRDRAPVGGRGAAPAGAQRATSSAGCTRTRKGEKAKTPSRFENYFAYQEPVQASC